MAEAEDKPNEEAQNQNPEAQAQAQAQAEDPGTSDSLADFSQKDGIKIVLQGRTIALSPLLLEDFPLADTIAKLNRLLPTEHQSNHVAKLIYAVIARSKLTPEELEILKAEPLKTYLTVSAAIERAIAELLQP